MKIAQAAPKSLAFIRRRRAARPKRSLADWIALTIARGLLFAMVGGLAYVTYVVEMAGYNDFRKCSKNRTLTRLEWVLGVRPAEDLWAVEPISPRLVVDAGCRVSLTAR
jgi:hypothetical protein